MSNDTDAAWLREAIELAKLCPESDTAFSVGAIIVAPDGTEISRGFSRETDPTIHAEESALEKAAGDSRLRGATMYSTLEPCGERRSRPLTCAQLIINAGIARVVMAWREPSQFVSTPAGVRLLTDAGVSVCEMPDIEAPFMTTLPLLYVVVTAAGPASSVDQLVLGAQQRGWEVQVISTPSAVAFIDTEYLTGLTGNAVRSAYRSPGEPRSRAADAIIVAPATFNTINKFAAGISDTYALGLLAEAIGSGLPVILLPFVNTALANREPFKRSVDQLRGEGAIVLLGPGAFEPHEPRTGPAHFAGYPWLLALDAATDARTATGQ